MVTRPARHREPPPAWRRASRAARARDAPRRGPRSGLPRPTVGVVAADGTPPGWAIGSTGTEASPRPQVELDDRAPGRTRVVRSSGRSASARRVGGEGVGGGRGRLDAAAAAAAPQRATRGCRRRPLAGRPGREGEARGRPSEGSSGRSPVDGAATRATLASARRACQAPFPRPGAPSKLPAPSATAPRPTLAAAHIRSSRRALAAPTPAAPAATPRARAHFRHAAGGAVTHASGPATERAWCFARPLGADGARHGVLRRHGARGDRSRSGFAHLFEHSPMFEGPTGSRRGVRPPAPRLRGAGYNREPPAEPEPTTSERDAPGQLARLGVFPRGRPGCARSRSPPRPSENQRPSP